jgi:signal transduction histidine kinase/CheY-like chemotaxis protein
MQRLVQVIQDLSRARSVEEIAAMVRVTARTLTGADGATFILKDGDECHYLDEDAIGPLWKGKRFPAASCVSGWCMEHREVAAIADIYEDPRIPQDLYRPTFVKSLVIVPIRSSDPIGAIGTYWAQLHAATSEEIAILQALADSTAIAMENAYLHASMQKQVQERTRESQLAREQAENATAAKSRFLAAASHNLRQPAQTLSAIAAILQRIRDDDESRPHLESLHQAIRNMQSMLDSLLDLHRLETGSIEPQRRDTSLDGVFAGLRSEFAYAAKAKSIVLETPRTAPAVHTDPNLLQEILRNFLANAIRYTAKGSVRLEHREEGNDVIVSVADTGAGIPDTHLSRIFEAFYRVDGALPRDGAEGLGLSIADQLARLLGHGVTVESQVGVGSRFSIAVPRSRTQIAAEESAAPASPPPDSGGWILYVEDDPNVRESMAMLLDIEGYDVVAVSAGAEALEVTTGRGTEPRIIISDYHLPGQTGAQVVQRIREVTGRQVPALLLTGETREARAASSPAAPDRVLYKPIDTNLLLNEIASLSNRR